MAHTSFIIPEGTLTRIVDQPLVDDLCQVFTLEHPQLSPL